MTCCYPCNRTFSSDQSLEQHLSTSSRHEWCHRCQRSFNSDAAKQQHLANSSSHHICNVCSDRPDYTSGGDLNKHLEIVHHYCTSCREYLGTAAQLTRHDIAAHNMCEICKSYFQTPQNLKAHRLTHEPKTVECYGCYNKFCSPSAMILHLEAGTCQRGTKRDDIVEMALECYQSRYYTSDCGGCPFQCPTCTGQFNSVSALFQHVESDCCDEAATSGSPLGKLLRFLETRV